MLPTWDDLQLYNIDLHIHAGTERPEAYSARDFIGFAVATGRRIIGVTDHFGRFLGQSKKRLNHYTGTLEGYRALVEDTRKAGNAYPDMIVLFGPEIGLAHLSSAEGELAFTVPGVDFFIGEPGGPVGDETLGELLIEGIRSIAKARERHGCPGTLGHPLRAPINSLVGKTGPGPRMPKHGPLPPLTSYENPLDHVEELLGIDIAALAAESISQDVPIEINESSWGRILGMNHESFTERYLFFYRTLIAEGARVVLASDMHNIEHGTPTPFVVARILGVQPRDMIFLRHWLGNAPE